MSAAKVKTPDGKRTSVQSINTEIPARLKVDSGGILSRIGKAYKSLNLFMAGMYTGVGCSGTPHAEHSYRDTEKPETQSDTPPI